MKQLTIARCSTCSFEHFMTSSVVKKNVQTTISRRRFVYNKSVKHGCANEWCKTKQTNSTAGFASVRSHFILIISFHSWNGGYTVQLVRKTTVWQYFLQQYIIKISEMQEERFGFTKAPTPKHIRKCVNICPCIKCYWWMECVQC